MSENTITEPTYINGGFVGSFFKPRDFQSVVAAGALTRKQIRAKHNLTLEEMNAIIKKVHRARLLDALFSWPDGPYYDIIMHLVAFGR